MTRWLERFAALVVVALLTWPLILLFVMYPTLVPILFAAVGGLLVGGYVGHQIGRKGAEFLARLRSEELDREWRQLFKELDADHKEELASKDAAIYMLRQFLNGQVFHAEQKEWGLTDG